MPQGLIESERRLTPAQQAARDIERQRKLSQTATVSAFTVADDQAERQRKRRASLAIPVTGGRVPDRVNAGHATVDQQLRDANFGPGIDDLNKKVLEAASGKPTKSSITRERSESVSLAKIIRNMFMQLLSGDQSAVGSAQTKGASDTDRRTTPDSTQREVRPKAKKKEPEQTSSNEVSKDDFTDLSKSINLLAGKVNV
jgi:hypothetical protein